MKNKKGKWVFVKGNGKIQEFIVFANSLALKIQY